MECPMCGTDNPDGASTCLQGCGAAIRTSHSPFSLPKGTELEGGEYRVGKVLGQGGFGITYKGVNTILETPRAIKELFLSGSARNTDGTVTPPPNFDTETYQMNKRKFLEEAQTIAKLENENIITVFDYFEDKGTAYYAMEYIEGQTLQESHIVNGDPLPEEQVIHYTLQILEALEEVHNAGLIHRDIKPENILIDENDRAVLIDFGATKQFARGQSVELSGVLTPAYAPLEQFSERAKIGPFTDLYALGSTMYYLLTNRQVFSTDRAHGLDCPAPGELNPTLSEEVDNAIQWAMEMRVTDRPQSVTEFKAALTGAKTTTHDLIECSQCHHSNPKNVPFCEQCAEPLTSHKSHIECQRCQNEIPGTVKYCIYCGEKQ